MLPLPNASLVQEVMVVGLVVVIIRTTDMTVNDRLLAVAFLKGAVNTWRCPLEYTPMYGLRPLLLLLTQRLLGKKQVGFPT